MSRSLTRRPMAPALTVLLAADPPPASSGRRHDHDADPPAGRYEALVSLARAVFAVGGRLALPVDLDVASIVGTVALDYAEPRVAERRTEASPPPMIVMETERPEPMARALLAPLAARGALRYLDTESEDVPLELHDVPFDVEDVEVHRQPVNLRMVDVTRPVLAVFIGPSWQALHDLDVLRQAGVQTIVFRSSILEPDLGYQLDVDDPTDRLLGEGRADRWSRRHDPQAAPHLPPYTFLMQRVVAELTEQSDY